MDAEQQLRAMGNSRGSTKRALRINATVCVGNGNAGSIRVPRARVKGASQPRFSVSVTQPKEKSAMIRNIDEAEPGLAAWDRKAVAEAAWDRKVRSEGLRCSVCAMKIPFANRDVYVRTRMCGYCAHKSGFG